MGKQGKCPAEFRERAVRLVSDQEGEHSSQWATIMSVAVKLGCSPETLRGWVRFAERQQIPSEQEKLAEQERIKELERENRELKQANEILRKAAAFFAQAELDRPRK